MRRRPMLLLAPAAVLACAAGVAIAQPGPPPGGPEVRVIRHGGPPSDEMKARHDAMKKQHMDDLKTVLRLRPDQEAALSAFMASHEPQRFEMKLPDPSPVTTTPQRLERMARREEAMRAAQAKHREALGRFYAALSPEQQKAFDALHRLQGHGGHGMMGHGGPGMMMLHGGPGGGDIMIRREIHGGPGGPHED